MRRCRALIIKEFFQIIRDPSSILISVVLPLVLLFVYGFGVSLDLNHLRIGLVLEDTSPTAQSFAKSFMNSPFFEVRLARDRRELNDEMVRGTIRGLVVLPAYFSAFKDRNNTAPIQVIADGSEPNTANFVQNYVQGAWQNWLNQEQISSDLQAIGPVRTQSRYWYNEQLESRNFLIPGSLAIIMTLIGTLLTALVVSREWERGTMEALLSTPVTTKDLLLGKFIPYYLLGMISMTICVSVAVGLYNVPLRGSFLTLAVVTTIFLFAALGLGLLVSTTSRSQVVSSQIALVLGFFPAFMLSGFIFEIASMPPLIQWLTYILPARYFVSCLQTIFLVGNVWSLLITDMAAMLVIGLLLLRKTVQKTIKRLD